MSGFGHRIVSATPNLTNKSILLVWDDGSSSLKECESLIGTKRIFRPLDSPELFAQVQIINDGRALSWPGDADMCADALWFEAHPADNTLSIPHSTAAE